MADRIGFSEEDRERLRDSVRRLLETHWPVEGAVERATDGEAIRALWTRCGAQGLTALGADLGELGLREILVVFAELGRASCPAPLVGAVCANLLFGGSGEKVAGAAGMLDGLNRGTETVAIALAAFDGDGAAGEIVYANGSVNGRAQFVEDAATATYLVALTSEPTGAAIVPVGAPGVAITPTPGLAVPPLSDVALAARPAAFVEFPAARLEDVALIVRLACLARATGAAQRAFDLAVDHAKLRRQFGQLIGTFQAIQHKLADCLTRLDGAGLLIESAAATHDRGDEAWRVFASAALAFAGPALRQTMLDAHHTLGAIGYAEEHEAPRHFRRIHADVARFGGANRARASLADHLLGPAGQG